MTALKPCPFCGELPAIHKHFKEELWQLIHRCPVMGPMILEWTEPEQRLINQWNIRKEASK